PDRERGPEGPHDVRRDEQRERRRQAVPEDARGPEGLAQHDRPLPPVPVRDHADGQLEDEEADPERDVHEGELEIRAEVAPNPQGPERDPDRERGGALVEVESADTGGGFRWEHASYGPKPEGILYPCGRTRLRWPEGRDRGRQALVPSVGVQSSRVIGRELRGHNAYLPRLVFRRRPMEKLIITVAPTGSVPRKKDTPHVPVTPDEIAETAYLCEQAGAAVIHVHCRDENERPTSRIEIFKETVDKIRKRTKLIVMTSTSGIAAQTDEDRATPLKTRPEMGSLTTGTLNFAGRKPAVVYVNTPETVQFLAKAMLDQHIKPELEAFDVGFVQQGKRLIESG